MVSSEGCSSTLSHGSREQRRWHVGFGAEACLGFLLTELGLSSLAATAKREISHIASP